MPQGQAHFVSKPSRQSSVTALLAADPNRVIAASTGSLRIGWPQTTHPPIEGIAFRLVGLTRKPHKIRSVGVRQTFELSEP